MGRSSWTANEEVRLLDAIEQFGFGNWEDIAKHIETRTPEGKYNYSNIKKIIIDMFDVRQLNGSFGRDPAC